MDVNLTIILLVISVFWSNEVDSLEINNQLSHVKKSKFPNFDSKPLEINSVNVSNSDNSVYCNDITAYYIGTLKNKKDPTKTYDVEFQLKLWVDNEKKKIHVYLDKWNEYYSNSQDFELDFYYGGNREWCDIYDDECASSFTKKPANFTLDLNAANGNYFHLLNFQNFNNLFNLIDSKGKCTKHQLDGISDDYTPNLEDLSFCVCCNNYEPDTLLNCPNDRWIDQTTTTEQPLTSSSNPPYIKTTTAFEGPYYTCQNIVGYYEGTFQYLNDPSYAFDAQFQFKANANLNDQRIYFGVDRWNKNFDFDYIGIGYLDSWDSDCDLGRNCSIAFPNSPVLNTIHICKSNNDENDCFDILDFENFEDSFTLKKTVGKCTKHQALISSIHFHPNPSLYSYCACCDEYDPDPSLNCPPNPWQYETTTTQFPTSKSTVKITESTTTTEPTTTTPGPEYTCQNIVGYYYGMFDYDFKIKANASLTDKKIYFEIDMWDWVANDSFIGMDYYYSGVRKDCFYKQRCSIPFPSDPDFNTIYTCPINRDYCYDILDFDNFENSFTLKNTVGKCTKHQPLNSPNYEHPNPNKYSYCVCCDEYEPDPSLDCPENYITTGPDISNVIKVP